jgi:Rieske Fe-S protein
MAVISGGIAIAPWVPSGGFLIPGGSAVLNGGEYPNPLFPRKIVANIHDESIEGGAIGDTLAPGSTGGRSIFFLYPDNSDTELTNVLIHLPPEDVSVAGTEWVAYNRTCIHLRCLVPYVANDADVLNPGPGNFHGQMHCPCHGSVYDARTGVPIAGPAHNDPSLGRPIAKVIIETPDKNGDIYARGIQGVIGYGRT